MADFEPGLSSEIFGNKYLAVSAVYIAPKDPSEGFRATSLAEEIGLPNPAALYSSLGRLRSAGLIRSPRTYSNAESDLFRVESELWKPLAELAGLVVAAHVEQPESD